MGKGFGICLRIILITQRDVFATDHDVADAFSRQNFSCIIHDRDLGASGNVNAVRNAFRARQRVACHLMRRLGHAVEFNYRTIETLF